MPDPALVPAREAAARLGVKRATLYAYVSRGLLTRHVLPGRRGSWFDPVQLDRLSTRAREPQERRPDLRITSAVTLIERGRYWYRGQSPDTLAAARSYEAVAEFLWTGLDDQEPPVWQAVDRAVEQARLAGAVLPASAAPTDRLRVITSVLGAFDPLRLDLRPAGALATARRLVASVVAVLARRRGGSVAAQVASWIGVPRGRSDAVAAVDDVLILLADHELAASTLAVRVASSFGAEPYAAVGAGLGAMSGTRHGAASRRVEQAFTAIARGTPPADAVGPLFLDPAAVPGFGHPLYPDGDPRVPSILALAERVGDTRPVEPMLDTMRLQGVTGPNTDFALAAFTSALGLTPGAGEALFTVARLAGWLAHAQEEYAVRSDFRMRAVYTGPRPDAATAPPYQPMT
ncbi:MAG: citrate/2-methylcitrate synthase [Vicinamibacterales bacterium]